MKLVSTALTLLALSAVLALSARADQIDYLIQFNNGADRSGDATTAAHRDEAGNPLPDHSMIVAVTRISTGNPIPGTFVLISSAGDLPVLDGHAKLYLTLNRDKCRANLVGCVVTTHVGGGVLQDIQISPVYMNSKFPWGNLQ